MSFSVLGLAQNGAASKTGTLSMQSILDLSIISNKLDVFLFDNAKTYTDGIVQNNAITFEVKSNVNWKVTSHTEQFYFTSTNAEEMPSTVLKISGNGAGQFQDLQQTPIIIKHGRRLKDGKAKKFSTSYKADPGFEYEFGVYEIEIIYTLSEQ